MSNIWDVLHGGQNAINTIFAGPSSGTPGPLTVRSLVAGDIPSLAYIPTSLMTTLGDLIYGGASGAATRLAGQISTTKMYLSQTGAAGPVSAAPIWAQISVADLANIAGGTVLGNIGTVAGAVVATTAPVLGIPGTSTGTIALASATASGKFTITAPASAATPTLTLPTNSGVAVNTADGTIFTASIGAAGALVLATQTANTVFAGPTTGSAAAPTFRTLVGADIPTLAPYFFSPFGDAGGFQGTNTIGTAAAGLVRCVSFVLPYAITVSNMIINVNTSSNGNHSYVALYNSAKNLVVQGTFNLTAATGAYTTSVTATPLPAGQYYLAWSQDNGTVNLLAAATTSATGVGIFNKNVVKIGTAANAQSGGTMPSALGVITTLGIQALACLLE